MVSKNGNCKPSTDNDSNNNSTFPYYHPTSPIDFPVPTFDHLYPLNTSEELSLTSSDTTRCSPPTANLPMSSFVASSLALGKKKKNSFVSHFTTPQHQPYHYLDAIPYDIHLLCPVVLTLDSWESFIVDSCASCLSVF